MSMLCFVPLINVVYFQCVNGIKLSNEGIACPLNLHPNMRVVLTNRLHWC